MKIVEALILLGLAGAFVAFFAIAIGRRVVALWRERREGKQPWRVVEKSASGHVWMYADKPGQDRLEIGAVPFEAEDFDSQLYELRAEARERVYALNQEEIT